MKEDTKEALKAVGAKAIGLVVIIGLLLAMAKLYDLIMQ